MVQRMLTAKDYHKSRLSLVLSGLADLPIGFIFLTIGILISVYFQVNPDQSLPEKTNEVFAFFILKHLPVGLRGLLIAGIFATSMGSLSAALNALATSYTRDWHPSSDSQTESVKTVRRFTYVFAVLMIFVAAATAYFVIEHPQSRIIPIVLGIFGYTYGSLLGIFLVGLTTKHRGSDNGNLIAMCIGFIAVAIVSGLPEQVIRLFFGGVGSAVNQIPAIPQIAFPFRILVGALTTFGCACLFPADKKA